jgi:hypothetical protein
MRRDADADPDAEQTFVPGDHRLEDRGAGAATISPTTSAAGITTAPG